MAYTKLPAWKAREIALDGFKVYTLYRNQFPYNCGYKDYDGTVWGDCWNMFPKSLIWSWACGLNLFLDRIPGTYFYNGQNGSYNGIGKSGLGDWDGDTIMSTCEGVSSDFRKLTTAELLLIRGHHMAMYIGDYEYGGKLRNSVEFNNFDEISGLVPFWTAEDGNRYWYKGGPSMGGKFDCHGKLTRWIDYNLNGLVKHADYEWYYYKDGKIDTSCNSIIQNEYGWWKVVNGKVDFGYNGLANNQYGWWMLQGGKVDFDFNGIACNENGFWVLDKGKVNFNYNGNYKFSGCTYKIKGGKVEP